MISEYQSPEHYKIMMEKSFEYDCNVAKELIDWEFQIQKKYLKFNLLDIAFKETISKKRFYQLTIDEQHEYFKTHGRTTYFNDLVVKETPYVKVQFVISVNKNLKFVDFNMGTDLSVFLNENYIQKLFQKIEQQV